MKHNIGDRVRVNCPESFAHGKVTTVISGLRGGNDLGKRYTGYQVDIPNPLSILVFEPHELIPIDDGNEKTTWDQCVWKPRRWWVLNKCHIGDCRDGLRAFAAAGLEVQTCVTSPPYFGLRDYGAEGQIGLERTPTDYVEKLVSVFALVRDVLSNDGTLWLNLSCHKQLHRYATRWGGCNYFQFHSFCSSYSSRSESSK